MAEDRDGDAEREAFVAEAYALWSALPPDLRRAVFAFMAALAKYGAEGAGSTRKRLGGAVIYEGIVRRIEDRARPRYLLLLSDGRVVYFDEWDDPEPGVTVIRWREVNAGGRGSSGR